MQLTKGIVHHVSEEARKEWEKAGGEQTKTKRPSCPSCEIKIKNETEKIKQ
jgi:hypothetical protein